MIATATNNQRCRRRYVTVSRGASTYIALRGHFAPNMPVSPSLRQEPCWHHTANNPTILTNTTFERALLPPASGDKNRPPSVAHKKSSYHLPTTLGRRSATATGPKDCRNQTHLAGVKPTRCSRRDNTCTTLGSGHDCPGQAAIRGLIGTRQRGVRRVHFTNGVASIGRGFDLATTAPRLQPSSSARSIARQHS